MFTSNCFIKPLQHATSCDDRNDAWMDRKFLLRRRRRRKYLKFCRP